ncbi:MAG: formate C-acetyltransferase [Erysipelotrichia bacterium]|nr:formate C-acetyltransferase [Erysipelotrichia bacterium]NCC54027.1 formate C-acetyltransferase [Erysipelotrichia bacterium]
MLSKRTQRIKDSLFAKERVVSLERAILYTESFKTSEGEDILIRRAKALKHILENHKIVIDDDDLLVGNRSEFARSGVISPEMSPYWILDELDMFATRDQDKFQISEKDKQYYREKLYPYWAGKSLKDYYNEHVSENVKDAVKTKVIAINQTDKGQGHIIPDYPLLLTNGLQALLDDVNKKHKQEPSNVFYQASKITLEAAIQYISRYASEVHKKIEHCTNETRKQELLVLEQILNKIAYHKPDSFYEAVQLFWLSCVIFQHESNASSISVGRFDQYMYPFYQKEKANTAFIKELLDCLYLKFNSIVAIRSSESAKFFAGFPIGYTLMVGGVDKDGRDASNEFSEYLLQLHKDIQLPQPNLSVRVNETTPYSLLKEAAKTIRLGNGLPQIFNDEANILAYVNRGVDLHDARDYAVVGCVELSIPAKTYGLHDIAMFNLLKCMEITMYENPDGFPTYESFNQAIKDNIAHYIQYMVEGSNTCDIAHKMCAPTPFLSTFIDGCLTKGADVTNGGAKYNFSGVQGIGCPNLSDSLYVVKKAVYEEHKISYQELLTILKNNWQGNEVLRQYFINKYHKYGNDYDEVDLLGADLLSFYGDEVAKYKNARGGIFHPGSYTVSAHIPLGEGVGASADGRKAKEQLADGGLSPMVGRDKNGPSASLKSVSKLDNILNSNGSLLNVKFSPSTLASDTGLDKLVAYLRSFSRLKLQHIQFNVVDKATLLDAQAHPEKHKDLVVRVAGYSAMFVELSKAIQDDIINRSEHTL